MARGKRERVGRLVRRKIRLISSLDDSELHIITSRQTCS